MKNSLYGITKHSKLIHFASDKSIEHTLCGYAIIVRFSPPIILNDTNYCKRCLNIQAELVIRGNKDK